MSTISGTASLSISKKSNLSFDDANALFDEANIYKVTMQVKLMDGTVHNIEVDDHFVIWGD